MLLRYHMTVVGVVTHTISSFLFSSSSFLLRAAMISTCESCREIMKSHSHVVHKLVPVSDYKAGLIPMQSAKTACPRC